MKDNTMLEGVEVLLVGTLTKHPETFRQVREYLRPDMFLSEQGRILAGKIWAAMQGGRWNKNIFAASITKFEAANIESAMRSADPENVADAAQLMASNWAEGRYYSALSDMVLNRNTFTDWRDADSILSEAKREILQNNSGKARSRDEVLESLVDDVMDGTLHGKTYNGIGTGFDDMDDLTGGHRPGQVIVVGARPGMGKTRYVIQQCLTAAKAKHSAVLYSLEMGAEEIYRVAMSWMTGIPVGRIMTYNLSVPHETDELAKAARMIKEWPFFVVDDVYTVEDLEFSLSELNQKENIRLYAVDYIQLLNKSTARRSDNRNNELSAISRTCKQLARQIGATGIVLSQLSRDIDKRATRRPVLADLRDSGAIESDADVVIFLHNPAVIDEKSDDPCELIVAKQRNGRLGSVLVEWKEPGFYYPVADQPGPAPFDPSMNGKMKPAEVHDFQDIPF